MRGVIYWIHPTNKKEEPLLALFSSWRYWQFSFWNEWYIFRYMIPPTMFTDPDFDSWSFWVLRIKISFISTWHSFVIDIIYDFFDNICFVLIDLI